MTNPTRQEIVNAHKALEDLKNVALNSAHFCSDTVLYTKWQKQILAALPPKPQPTMAGVEWDDELHYLAEAEHDVYGQVIMLASDVDGLIEFFIPARRDFRCDTDRPCNLTPTGKRYALKEEQ